MRLSSLESITTPASLAHVADGRMRWLARSAASLSALAMDLSCVITAEAFAALERGRGWGHGPREHPLPVPTRKTGRLLPPGPSGNARSRGSVNVCRLPGMLMGFVRMSLSAGIRRASLLKVFDRLLGQFEAGFPAETLLVRLSRILLLSQLLEGVTLTPAGVRGRR